MFENANAITEKTILYKIVIFLQNKNFIVTNYSLDLNLMSFAE